jgi:hypothetical protein
MRLLVDGNVIAITGRTGMRQGNPPSACAIRHHAMATRIPLVKIANQTYKGFEWGVQDKGERIGRHKVIVNTAVNICGQRRDWP